MISTTKTEEEIFICLQKLTGNYYGTKTEILTKAGCFILHRELQTSDQTFLTAAVSILMNDNLNKNLVHIKLTVKSYDLLFFAVVWCSIGVIAFCLLVYNSIKDGTFHFAIFVPLLFVFMGYGFSILTMQGAIDELSSDIIKILT